MTRLRRWTDDTFRIRVHGDDCIYCGEIATTGDHWPPVAVTGPSGRGLILPACAQCNSLAERKFPYSFADRAIYVKKRLKDRLKRFLNHPEWSEAELAEMAPEFRKSLLAWNLMKQRAHARIEWNSISALANIIRTNDFVHLHTALDFGEDRTPPWFTALNPELFEMEALPRSRDETGRFLAGGVARFGRL